MTNITDSFEYHAEQAKQNFQAHINSLLEAHSDFNHKISAATGAKKTGVWLELSEAEIINYQVFEAVSNIMASYEILNNTNKWLNTNYRAYQHLFNDDIRKAISDFKNEAITKDQFAERVSDYAHVRKPNVAA